MSEEESSISLSNFNSTVGLLSLDCKTEKDNLRRIFSSEVALFTRKSFKRKDPEMLHALLPCREEAARSSVPSQSPSI